MMMLRGRGSARHGYRLSMCGCRSAKAFEVRDGSYAPADLEGLKENFQRFMKDVRSFGITELHEGSKLSEDEENFNNRIKPYRVVTLENAAIARRSGSGA